MKMQSSGKKKKNQKTNKLKNESQVKTEAKLQEERQNRIAELTYFRF